MGGWCSRKFGTSEKEEEQIVSHMQIPIVWVLGGPGSGKTTISLRLATRYKFTYVSIGDMICNEVQHNSKIGQKILKEMREGKLVSRDILFTLVQHTIATSARFSQGYILDGYPRELEQRIDLEAKISPPVLILYFRCADETMKLRMYTVVDAPDANSTILETRKYIYQMLTKVSNFNKFARPVVENYPDQRKVAIIDAEQDKLKVYIQCRREMDLMIRKLKRTIHTVFEEDTDFFV